MMYKLSKLKILRNHDSFQTVYRSGKSYSNRMMVLYLLANGGGPAKVGFAAGKRLGNAVIRNRVKRLLREVYRLNHHKLQPSFDLILVGRRSLIKLGYQDAVFSFLDLCGKARILNE